MATPEVSRRGLTGDIPSELVDNTGPNSAILYWGFTFTRGAAQTDFVWKIIKYSYDANNLYSGCTVSLDNVQWSNRASLTYN